MHKTANVLVARPKSVQQPKVKSELGEIWLSGGDSANKTFDGVLAKYSDKYPAAMKKKTDERSRRTARLLRFSGCVLGFN
ncbi:putative transposase mutator type [Candidatus Erwinia dacicola]|uniref:Transposase mutator type n=1 Tax=Candidatus Erwinia dacicola TaxID=252393 RepID=A0A328THC4_9GAMM|nr:putative transposase mutator type [Candidatus Erwinia dacicola]